MRRKYFGSEQVFEFIWNNADEDGLWAGDTTTLAAEFHVAEDESYAALGELCGRNRIQRTGAVTCTITKWPER
jgi:hypothetical protein